MEKAVFVACAVFILYIGYKVPQGFAQGSGASSTVLPITTTQAPGNVNCTAFNTTDQCCDTKWKGACIFLNCTDKESKTHEECHFQNYTISDVCMDPSGANKCALPTVSPSTPTAAPGNVNCTAFNTTDQCCDTKWKGACIFLNCTDKESKNHEECHFQNYTISDVCKDPSGANKCDAHTTTPAPTTTTSTKTDKTSTSSKTTTQTTAGPLKSTPSGQADDGSKQHFDAASFVGGIVLCLGIVAIIFFGCKFYKARTERNYHTL